MYERFLLSFSSFFRFLSETASAHKSLFPFDLWFRSVFGFQGTLSSIINSQCHSLHTLCFAHVLYRTNASSHDAFASKLASIPARSGSAHYYQHNVRHPPVLPCCLRHSTFGRVRLNRRVRYGYGCFPFAYRHRTVEMERFELLTPCLQGRCSPN